MNRVEKTDSLLLVSFLALMTFPLLYALRGLDDNALTSWRWVFADGGMARAFGFIALGTAVAFFGARTPLVERRPAFVLVSLSVLAVLPLWQEPEVILDASRYFLQAKHLELYGPASFFREWGREISAWTDLPVVPFLYGVLFKCLGETRTFIQLFTTLLFSVTVLLTHRIGALLWDRELGTSAGLLLLGIPYLLVQVPLMLTDVPVMFLFTLCLFTFLIAVEKGGFLRMALSSSVIVLTLFAKYSAWPMLLVLPIVTLVSIRRGAKAALSRSALILAAAGTASAAAFLAGEDVFTGQIAVLRDYQWPGLGRWKEGFISTFLFQTHPFVSALALCGAITAVGKRDIRFLIPAWFAVFALALRVERIRYLLPLFPLLALMAAYGLRELKHPEVRRFVAGCAVAASVALALGAYLPFLNKTTMANLRDAGRYLDTLPGEAAAIHALPQTESAGNTEAAIPILDLFTQKRLVYLRERPLNPDGGRIKTSPLRFTWDIKLPGFYSDEGAAPRALPAVVISSEAFAPSTQGGAGGFPAAIFASDTGTFRYKTFVFIAGGNVLSETAQ